MLTGYASEISVEPDGSIQFMVSTDAPQYQAEVVRLIHGDEAPDGPGFKHEPMRSAANGIYHGRLQDTVAGSCAFTEPVAAPLAGLTIHLWIFPTTPSKPERQGLVVCQPEEGTAARGGYGLYLDPERGVVLRIGDRLLASDAPVQRGVWHVVTASYDNSSGQATARCVPLQPVVPSEPCVAADTFPSGLLSEQGGRLLLAASSLELRGDGRPLALSGLFNGKLDRTRLFAEALSSQQLAALERGVPADAVASTLAWEPDMGFRPDEDVLPDRSGHTGDAVVINAPTRLVTGSNWNGESLKPGTVPDQYEAIHFHDDDLADASWLADLELTIPSDWDSGIFALWIRAGDQEDHIPFIVRPPAGAPRARLVLLLPTFTYMAYANNRDPATTEDLHPEIDWTPVDDPGDRLLAEHEEWGSSLYNRHSDGSGVCLSTYLRPIPCWRPKYRYPLVCAPRHLGADLYLIDWLHARGFQFDVLTDHDLHCRGEEGLVGYNVVMTGSHPEYVSERILDSLEAHLGGGGRMMYLGGNGFYWVTSTSSSAPHIIEVRRGQAGSRPWESLPGETHHQTTGEVGGSWRYRGRPPNRLVGVGFTAQGWDGRSTGYHRKAEIPEELAFVFEGVAPDETIGDFGLVMGGAGGDELDRLDRSQGSPPAVVALASSGPHSEAYVLAIEDHLESPRGSRLSSDPRIRADMTLMPTKNGGAVFSTGSICWAGSLSHGQYDNNVSRVTENVLRRFLQGRLTVTRE
jgi:N,N-dimethylformamidase